MNKMPEKERPCARRSHRHPRSSRSAQRASDRHTAFSGCLTQERGQVGLNVSVELPPRATASGRLAEVAMHDELAARHRAITLRLAGRPTKAICAAVGRSVVWLRKWWGRYLEADPEGLYDLTRANHHVAQRIPPELERAILSVLVRPATAGEEAAPPSLSIFSDEVVRFSGAPATVSAEGLAVLRLLTGEPGPSSARRSRRGSASPTPAPSVSCYHPCAGPAWWTTARATSSPRPGAASPTDDTASDLGPHQPGVYHATPRPRGSLQEPRGRFRLWGGPHWSADSYFS